MADWKNWVIYAFSFVMGFGLGGFSFSIFLIGLALWVILLLIYFELRELNQQKKIRKMKGRRST